jgi:hypothetical protein
MYAPLFQMHSRWCNRVSTAPLASSVRAAAARAAAGSRALASTSTSGKPVATLYCITAAIDSKLAALPSATSASVNLVKRGEGWQGSSQGTKFTACIISCLPQESNATASPARWRTHPSRRRRLVPRRWGRCSKSAGTPVRSTVSDRARSCSSSASTLHPNLCLCWAT